MSSSTILVSCETNDWGFGQDKFNVLKEILRIGSSCLYSACVPLVHLVFTHPWNVSEKKKTLGNYISFLPMKNAVQHI